MKKIVSSNNCVIGGCPTIYEEGDNLIIVGKCLSPEQTKEITLEPNEQAVIIPKTLIKNLP